MKKAVMAVSRQTIILWTGVGIYILAMSYSILESRDAISLRRRRETQFSDFSKLVPQIGPALPSNHSREPLLIRLQKSIEQFGLKDRAPKLSAGPASPGLPPTVTLSMEGVPFDQVSLLLERLSVEPGVAVSVFRIERSGASNERFDFSTTFTELPEGAGLSAP